MNKLPLRHIHRLILLLFVVVLFSCQDMPANVSSDPAERILNGDRVRVVSELSVPAHKASVMLQHGRIINESVDRFEASCRFVMKAIRNAPQKIAPGEFRVSNVRYWEDFVAPDVRVPLSGGEFINYEITLRLQSEKQPEVYSLVCQHDDDHVYGRHLNVREIQQALSRLVRIIKH
ncbi:hypothetical protein [Thiohalophilus thiocyanatoxydans]|uniref:Lipoprotein n=1 Tax=Thiohalophilus thiocyanatoxydans TaxID=381308 RepID=A0A4R8IIS9_9GAMM|nr:hypothetical protein [Thiohalophilus thiocyanatoxydans]TDY00616.1 hypothetical protein EDC23_2120 [Thiohalophilus thiocyanatoxydans]